jgi:hypothetical protein
MTSKNLHCPRTGITHGRTKDNMPVCDPRGWRHDFYIDAALHVTCAACLHAMQADHHQESA